jgi:hypothetical protein
MWRISPNPGLEFWVDHDASSPVVPIPNELGLHVSFKILRTPLGPTIPFEVEDHEGVLMCASVE